mmetsp:Transcript_47084/g.110953  ORF Transcript_47084/g.110953 Transcript_47084/m.110953 type:complete len:280 (-) Transcript_47084:797-1636(-)
MRPKPMNPRFLPASSCPVRSALSHLPSRSERSARGIMRACERRCASASSTTELVADSGEFTTMTPTAEAALRSTLSTPTPARATSRSFEPGTAVVALRTAALILVAERMMMASYSASPPAASSSLVSFFFTTSCPACARVLRAAAARPSVTMIFIFLTAPALILSCAYSIHTMSASTSLVSTVGPHQMRRPAGASRYEPMSYATALRSRRSVMVLTSALVKSLITRHTEVLEMVAGSLARNSIHGFASTNFLTTLKLRMERVMRPASPPHDLAHLSASM